MKHYIKAFVIFFCVLYSQTGNSQVLISLLFGDMLNTDKIEFGLIGGMNRSWLYDIEGSKGLNNFNIGFYFHILLKESSYLSTGVLVKTNMGATGMPTYAIGDSEFDEVFKDATLTKKINYFYVPIMYHYRFKQRWYMEGGIQAGLRNGGKDIFDQDAYDGEISYDINVKSDYTHFDFGLIGGAGYKFKKKVKSMSAGINYYYGLVDVARDDAITLKNSTIYFYIKIPIGAGKAEKKAAEKAAAEQDQ